MNYKEAIDWLFMQLPMYQNQGKSAYKKDLSNTILLSNYLKNPEHKFKSIHIGGTNGKGSCSHILASILQEAGYKVGLYTSPHLKDYRERIKINGLEIPEAFVLDFILKHKMFFIKNSLSFFEMTVGLAFDYFAKEKVDYAIIEVGLGGRLDSTNIISPILSVITNIGLDHTQFLGDTLQKIAKEKAGIIKSNTPVVIGETQLETKPVFISIADSLSSKILFAEDERIKIPQSNLKGEYQKKNIRTVLVAIEELLNNSLILSKENINQGLQNVSKNTGLKGRWEILQNNPKIIVDTAHNKEGLTIVMQQLKQEAYKTLHIVFGVVKDKDLEYILDLLPKDAIYYLCKPNISRGLDTETLHKNFLKHDLDSNCYGSVNQAFDSAKFRANNDDVIYVGGSTFVVSEII